MTVALPAIDDHPRSLSGDSAPFDHDTMPTASERITHREPWRLPAWLGLCFSRNRGLLPLGGHRACGALPIALLLCPVIHLFMRRGHGGHAGHAARKGRPTRRRRWEAS
jgi:hypothetical protein